MAAGWLAAPLEQLKTGSPDGKRWAASSLRSLASTNVEHKDAVAELGAIPVLVDLLSTGTEGTVAEAAGALRAIADNNQRHQDMIAETGAIPKLISLLLSSSQGVPEEAAGMLMCLASGNPMTRRRIMLSGAVPPLIKAIRSKVALVTLIVDNVDSPEHGERRSVFVDVIQQALAAEIGQDVAPTDVLVGMTSTRIAQQAVTIPSMLTHCMVYVASTVDTAEVQRRIRASRSLGASIGKSLTERRLQYNPLRSVHISGITTPATVSFSFRLAGFDFQRLLDEEDNRLLLAFRSRVQLAVALELGTLILPEGVSVKLTLASDVVKCVLTPPAKVDTCQVLLFLKSSLTNLGPAIVSALSGGGGGDGQQEGQQSSDVDVLFKEATTGELQVTIAGEPRLRESTYVRSGARKTQVFATGALRNLMYDDPLNQDTVVQEAGVPALVELLKSTLPFGDLFNQMDVDSSGGISMAELAAGLRRFGWNVDIQEIWTELDKDKSGAVTYEELVDRLSEECQAAEEKTSHSSVMAALVTFLKRLFDDTLVFEQAAGALRNLCAQHADATAEVIEAGAVVDLIDLMQCSTMEVREQANGALCHLGRPWCDKQVQRLGSEMMCDRVDAARLLRRLANVNAEHRRTVVEAGAVEPLVKLMESGHALAIEHAVAALSNIMFKSKENEKAVVEAGAVQYFVEALKSTNHVVQEVAMRATKMVIQGEPISLRKVFDAGGIEVMVALLKSNCEAMHKKVINILMTLVLAHEYRKHVLKAGFQQTLLEVSTAAEDEGTRRCAEDAMASLEALLQEGGARS